MLAPFMHARKPHPSLLLPLFQHKTDDDGAAGAQGGGAEDDDGEGGDKVEDDAGLLRPYTDVPWHRKGGLVTVTSNSGQVRERTDGRNERGEKWGRFLC